MPNETLQTCTCDEMNRRKPQPSKVLIIAALTAEGSANDHNQDERVTRRKVLRDYGQLATIGWGQN